MPASQAVSVRNPFRRPAASHVALTAGSTLHHAAQYLQTTARYYRRRDRSLVLRWRCAGQDCAKDRASQPPDRQDRGERSCIKSYGRIRLPAASTSKGFISCCRGSEYGKNVDTSCLPVAAYQYQQIWPGTVSSPSTILPVPSLPASGSPMPWHTLASDKPGDF